MASSHSKRVSPRIAKFKVPVFYGDSTDYSAFAPIPPLATPSAPPRDPISPDVTQKIALPRDPVVRRLIVCNALRDIQGSNGRRMRAPQLLLRGRWLQRAGFHAGVPVKVHVSPRQLVIEYDGDRAPRDEVLTRIAQVTEDGLSERDLDALIRRLKRNKID